MIDTSTAGKARHRGARGHGTGMRAALAAVPLAVLASGAMVYQASNAAFTASTSTGANSWTAGTVALSNSTSGAALFTATNVKPAAANAVSTCLTVTYTGSLASDVRFYVTGFSNPTPGANSHNLGSYLRLSIEQSSTATPADCSTFTRIGGSGTFVNASGAAGNPLGGGAGSLATAATDWASGLGSWAAPAGNSTAQTRSYKITYWLPDYNETGITTGAPTTDQNTLNDLQGAAAQANLVWEARNS